MTTHLNGYSPRSFEAITTPDPAFMTPHKEDSLLWIPYTILAVVLIVFFIGSFLRYRKQRRLRQLSREERKATALHVKALGRARTREQGAPKLSQISFVNLVRLQMEAEANTADGSRLTGECAESSAQGVGEIPPKFSGDVSVRKASLSDNIPSGSKDLRNSAPLAVVNKITRHESATTVFVNQGEGIQLNKSTYRCLQPGDLAPKACDSTHSTDAQDFADHAINDTENNAKSNFNSVTSFPTLRANSWKENIKPKKRHSVVFPISDNEHVPSKPKRKSTTNGAKSQRRRPDNPDLGAHQSADVRVDGLESTGCVKRLPSLNSDEGKWNSNSIEDEMIGTETAVLFHRHFNDFDVSFSSSNKKLLPPLQNDDSRSFSLLPDV